MNKSKKIISIVAAATLAFSTLALAGCGSEKYAGEKLSATDTFESVSSNGGFAVETKDYVYFINGTESNTAKNSYGDVVKGSLMRISKTELAKQEYDAAQIVVPSLFVAGDYTSGVFIYGGYVYYATPTTDKDPKTGVVENSYLDFKRSKLDGSEAPMGGKNDYFFRLSSNSAKYRFVEVDGTVYCMFEEDSKLKSYNVETGKTTVLVSGAKSSFYYDLKDPTNPNVYYTMGVTYDLDKKTSTTAQYDQVYTVNAAATAKTDKAKASYTVYNGETEIATYDFDEKFMKDNAKEKKYDLGDYTTYPYVNLGSLVLDGVGSAPSPSNDNRFNKDDKAESSEPLGYNYTIQSYQNDGLYFTRKALNATTSETENAKLYYLADEKDANWNTVTGNANVDIVALDTTNASASALFEVAEDGTHSYIYTSGTILKRAVVDANGEATETPLVWGVSSPTLWKTEGDYLFYYTAATNGNNVIRINYKGEAQNYKLAQSFGDSEDYADYKPLVLPLVDWNSAWYKPEIVTDSNGNQVLLYANAQSYGAGTTAYNYIYATKLGTAAEINARVDELAEVNDFIESYVDNSQLQAVMNYYYKTGKTEAFDAVKDVEDLYTKYQKDEFDAFKAKFAEGGEFAGKLETSYITLVGRMTKADEEKVYTDWAKSLLSEKVEEVDNSLPTWAIVLIVVGGVLVVAAAVGIPVGLYLKKKADKKKADEAIVSAYSRKKIDTTDDKSIDVYADEEAETPAEEAVETPVEETEAPAEEPAEEATEETEAPAEEPVEEATEETETPAEAPTEE